MEKFITATGKTIDLAIAAALEQLGMDRDSVSVEVLDNPKSGFLGIGAQPAKVKVTYEARTRHPSPHCPPHPEASPRSPRRKPPQRRRSLPCRSGRSTCARNGTAEIRAEIRAEARGKAAAAQTRA